MLYNKNIGNLFFFRVLKQCWGSINLSGFLTKYLDLNVNVYK